METLTIGLRALAERIGWYDPTRRRVLIRGAIGAVAYAIATGWITIPPQIYALLSNPTLAMFVMALLIPAGERNPGLDAIFADVRSAIDTLDIPPAQRAVLVAILDARTPGASGSRPA